MRIKASDGGADKTTCTVVGGGVIGLSVALHLLDAGVEVRVVEGIGIGAGASSVQPGGVRQQWGTTANCQMARAAFRFYLDFPSRYETRAEARLEQCGYVFAATEQRSLWQLEKNVAVQHAAGIPSQLLSADDASELIPSLNSDRVVGAAYCKEDGYFDRPQAVVEAFAELVVRAGGQIAISAVRSIERDGAGWSVGLGDGSTETRDLVVVAAGADSVPLLQPIGFDLPIAREARHLFYSEHIRERLIEPLFIAVDLGLAAKHLADGRVLASDLHAVGDPDGNQGEWRRRIHETIAEIVPILEYVSLPIIATGYYDMTPDGQPIIDELERGLWVAAGFSGHGFMVAPVVGQRIAAAISGQPAPDWATAVSLVRLNSKLTETEAQVI